MNKIQLSRRTFLKGTALSAVGVALAACTAPTAAPAGGSEAASETSTLVVASFYPVDQTAGWDGLVEQFEADHPGLTVETQVTPFNEYLPKLLTQIASNSVPDVLGVENTPFIQFVDKNVLLNLSPLLEDDPVFKPEDFFPKLIGRYTVNGNIYGIPYDVQPICCLFYNKGHFDEAGIDYPTDEWRWNDLLEASLALTKTEGDRTTQYGFHTGGDVDRNLFVYSNGGTVADSVENPTKATFDNPKTIEGVQFWADLINEHKVAPTPEFLQSSGQGVTDMFATGRLSSFVGGYWSFVFSPDKFKQVDLGLQIAPAGPEGTRGYATGGTAYCVANDTQQVDAAWEFTKFFMGQPGYDAAFSAATLGIIYPPAYIPSYNSHVYLGRDEPPIENMQINGNAAEFAWFTPHHPAWVELRSTTIIPTTQLIANGDKSVEEGLAEMQEEAQKALGAA
ncbi:sugar ABC transporter substrate-binding protein [Chloroflexi bacterium TSY]|nr:sugar ABC transporter substrate-binding protein [Chloroflexi bacterium TSY]